MNHHGVNTVKSGTGCVQDHLGPGSLDECGSVPAPSCYHLLFSKTSRISRGYAGLTFAMVVLVLNPLVGLVGLVPSHHLRHAFWPYQSCGVLGSLPGLVGDGTEVPGEKKMSGPQWLVANGPSGRYPRAGRLLQRLHCACTAGPQQGVRMATMLPAHSQLNTKALGSSQKWEPTQV